MTVQNFLNHYPTRMNERGEFEISSEWAERQRAPNQIPVTEEEPIDEEEIDL